MSDDIVERLRGHIDSMCMNNIVCGDAADLIDAIDALHQPRVIVYRPNDDHDIICNECDKPWPCWTHSLLHPEEASRG